MSSLRAFVRHPEFLAGAKEMAVVMPGMSAWGLVTGVAMVKGGLSVPMALFMTFAVYAGSSQLAALPLLAVNAPIWVIWATAFCVNLRFVIFSAQWRPYFMHLPLRWRLVYGYFAADLSYVLFMKRFEARTPCPAQSPDEIAQQKHFLFGGVSVNWLMWQAPTVAGILLADSVPTHWGLGFAGVLALLGLTYSLLSDRVTAVSALVAAGAAVAAFALPFRLHIVVAIAAAVCVGLMIDAAEAHVRDVSRRRA